MRGKSIIVTGGGSGIGRATCLLLGEVGCKVTVADRDPAGAEQTAALVIEAGGTAQHVAVDVSVEDQVEASVKRAVEAYGGLHGAFNAAGVPGVFKPLHKMTLQDMALTHKVNFTGVFLCMKHQIPAMLDSGGGSIVVTSSVAAECGIPMAADYCSSKAAVVGLVRAASAEYAKRGVRVNAILPGMTYTPMVSTSLDTNPDLEAHMRSIHPIGRFAEPIEIATAARWLLSDEASFVTGTAMPVDGGATSV